MNNDTPLALPKPAPETMRDARSSRKRYHGFVREYKERRLDDTAGLNDDQKQFDEPAKTEANSPDSKRQRRRKRREYLREYGRWLWPHRYAVGLVFVFALLAAGLQMAEPLFMRFIIDRILLNVGLNSASRLTRLDLAGVLFVGVIVFSNLMGVVKD